MPRTLIERIQEAEELQQNQPKSTDRFMQRVLEAEALGNPSVNPAPTAIERRVAQEELEAGTPKAIFKQMRENPSGPPGRGYSDEEIDRALEYIASGKVDVGAIIPAGLRAVSTTLTDFKNGLGSYLESIWGGIKEGPEGVAAALVGQGVSAIEGSARGLQDSSILAAESYIRSRVKGAKNRDTAVPEGTRSGRMRQSQDPRSRLQRALEPAQPKPQEKAEPRAYRDFDEEEKAKMRKSMRLLLDNRAQRGRQIEGGETILGNVMTAATGNPDWDSMAMNLIVPESAELYSYILDPAGIAAGGVMGAGAKLGIKGGPNIIRAAEDAVAGTAEATARGIRNATEIGEKTAAKLQAKATEAGKDVGGTTLSDFAKEGFNLGVWRKAQAAINNTAATIEESIAAFRRHAAMPTDENILARVARDTRAPVNTRLMANTLANLGDLATGPLGATLGMLGSTAFHVGRASREAARGSAIGGLIALPSMDGETIGGAMGSAGTLAGMARFAVGKTGRQKMAVDDFFQRRPSSEAATKLKSRLSDSSLEMISKFERVTANIGRGTMGQPDIPVYIVDDGSYAVARTALEEGLIETGGRTLDEVQSDIEKLERNTAGGDKYAPRGVQSLNPRNGKPFVIINADRVSDTTLVHEMVHALNRFPEFSEQFSQVHKVLFDQKIDGELISEGLLSDEQLDQIYDQYMARFDVMTDEGRAMVEQLDSQAKAAASRALQGTLEADVDFQRRAMIKEEIVADAFESLLISRPPNWLSMNQFEQFIWGARNSISSHLGNMLRMTDAMGKDSVPSQQGFRANAKDVVYPSKALSEAVNQVMRARRKLETDAEGNILRPSTREEPVQRDWKPQGIKRGTALAKALEGSILVQHDKDGNAVYDAGGRLQLVDGPKALKAKERARNQFVKEVLNVEMAKEGGLVGDADSVGRVPLQIIETEDGKSWISGDYINDEVMQKLRDAPKDLFPRRLLENLEIINDAMKEGLVLEWDYNARLNKANRYDSSIGSSVRHAVPYSVNISKAGNIYFRTLDLGHMVSKFERSMGINARQSQLNKLWNGSKNAFFADVVKYVENTRRPTKDGDYDLAQGIGRDKANAISAFFGFTKKDINFENNRVSQRELLNAFNKAGDSGDIVIRSRRLDSVNQIKDVGYADKFPLSIRGRELIQRNFEPDGEPKTGRIFTRFEHRDGTGLMNNQGLDRMRLSDSEEEALVDLMDFGLEQPRDVPGGSVFVFDNEGLEKHKKLIRLLRKASKTGVVKKVFTSDVDPVWVSQDGQLAFKQGDLKEIRPSNARFEPDSEVRPKPPAFKNKGVEAAQPKPEFEIPDLERPNWIDEPEDVAEWETLSKEDRFTVIVGTEVSDIDNGLKKFADKVNKNYEIRTEEGVTEEFLKGIPASVRKYMEFDSASYLDDNYTQAEVEGKTYWLRKKSKARSTEARFEPDSGGMDSDYRGEHGAPDQSNGKPISDLSGLWPDDILGPNGAKFYGDGHPEDANTIEILKSIQGNPDKEVKVYRAVPKGSPREINSGDWVTVNKRYAEAHGKSVLDGEFDVVGKVVKAGEVYSDGNSIHEQGYLGEVKPSNARSAGARFEPDIPRVNQINRHAELERRFSSGEITPEEMNEAQRLVEEAALNAGFVRLSGPTNAEGKFQLKGGAFVGKEISIEDANALREQFLDEYEEVGFRVQDESEVNFPVEGDEVPNSMEWGVYNESMEEFVYDEPTGREAKSISASEDARFAVGERFNYYPGKLVYLVGGDPGIMDHWNRDDGEVVISNGVVLRVFGRVKPGENLRQIKSADPFTGIPLEQRFNPESDKILE